MVSWIRHMFEQNNSCISDLQSELQPVLSALVGEYVAAQVFGIASLKDAITSFVGPSIAYQRVKCCAHHHVDGDGGFYTIQVMTHGHRLIATSCACAKSTDMTSVSSLPYFTATGSLLCEHQIAAHFGIASCAFTVSCI